MRATAIVALLALSAAACGRTGQPAQNDVAPAAAADDGPVTGAGTSGWDLQSSGEGTALALLDSAGATAIRLFCPAGKNQLLVNVPAFRAIGSEERMSIGSGGTAVALVADPSGDSQRGGVSAAGPVPDEIKAVVGGPVSASYGAQTSGPHPAPPEEAARAFVTACFDNAGAAGQAAARPTPATSPCLVQDGELLRLTPLRAVGTEPFWAARIEGRCVTYSHPEDQAGTRVWTKFAPGPRGGVWSGALGGKPFVLRTEPVGNCSDGMSDKIYPLSVRLTVGGEERRGCAEPQAAGR